MLRTILAATLSAALALPVLTAPASAHETGYGHRHDRGSNAAPAIAVIGGLTALYLLKRHSDRRDDRRAAPVRRAAPLHRNDTFRAPRHQQNARVLPDRCYRAFNTRRGQIGGYGARCLQRTVARPGSLPPQCITQVRTDRGLRNLYTARCLRRAGWTSRAATR